ncbi:MAG: AAA family ATPase [Thermoanaerobaculia bacterium]
MPGSAPPPAQIAAALERRVFGQTRAVRETAIAVAKHLADLEAGNLLLIGSSGTGKTTLLRAVEAFLAADPALADRATLIRIHANLLSEEAAGGRGGEAVLTRLLERAHDQLGERATIDELLARARHGIVFIDEIDKIRAKIDGRAHLPGIRAQEALLTLIENESIPLALPERWGGGSVSVDASRLLFVGAGAFETLYDAVYDRVTVGSDRGALKEVTVVEGERLRREERFVLRDWLRSEDLFDYGMTPQFLSRFESVVLLHDLAEEQLLKILLEGSESPLRRAQAYFASQGVELALSPAAARRIAAEAAAQPRLGARAVAEVFRRVIRDHEFEPASQAHDGVVVIDQPEVEAALVPGGDS